MDVWEYFEQRDREIADQSAAWDEDIVTYAEERGSNGQRGRVFGRVLLTDRAYLQVHEVVEVQGSGVHRVEYAYFFIYDGTERWGEERDPTHDPAVHRHDRNHKRFPSEPVSFKEALTLAWESVSVEEALEDTDPDER